MASSSPKLDTIVLIRAGVLVFSIAGLGNLVGVWDSSHFVVGLPNLCLFHALTGHNCPGCGMGRALVLLTHGQILASLHQHPFGLFLLLWMIGWALVPQGLLLRLQGSWLVRTNTLSAGVVALLFVWWLLHSLA